MRQTDPERGKSPWRRGVRRNELVLVCPACQESGDWTAELESCARCASVHLIRRLGQVECLDCGLVREPEAALVHAGSPSAAGPSAGRPSAAGPSAAGPSAAGPSAAGPSAAGPDAALAEEVGRALDRLLGRR